MRKMITNNEFSEFLFKNSENMTAIMESMKSFDKTASKEQVFHLLKFFYLYNINRKLDIDMGA